VSHSKSSNRSSGVARWRGKFYNAFCGVFAAVRNECSFRVHLPVAVAVVAAGLWLRLSVASWALLTLCIAAVIAAELFNSSIERLAAAITREESAEIGDALDMAGGAVLIAATGAVVVGLAVLGPPLWTAVFG